MRDFFRQTLIFAASMLLALFLVVIVLSMGISALQKAEQPKITANSVLRIVLEGDVKEHNPHRNIPLLLQQNASPTIALNTLKEAIKAAKGDARIRGILLEAKELSVGWASLQEIREALLDFKQAGKFVIACGDSYSLKTYYLAALSDEIFLHPEGIFRFNGMSKTVMFYQSLLEKLSIKPQILRVGKYKSFTEPFTRQDMSPANRKQCTALIENIYEHILQHIGEGRKLAPAVLRKGADDLSVAIPANACKMGLVSRLGYYSDVEKEINTRLGTPLDAAIHHIDFARYASLQKPHRARQDKIAVIVAEGHIQHGKGQHGTISSAPFVKLLRAAREDKTIKGVVLRINSPGGSALASDILWQEIKRLREEKPVVASMADVAASGGYYMAAACNHITAQHNTVTGSIGVWGLFFDTHALLSRIGITTDVVKTNVSADLFINPGRPTSPREKRALKKVIEKIYDTFLDRVAEGRNMEKDAVEHIAAGRVWSGKQAQGRGLVDTLGGLNDAIATAAKLAKLEGEYAVIYRPKTKSLWEFLFEDELSEAAARRACIQSLQEEYPILRYYQELSTMQGIQARLPYTFSME